MKNSAEEVATLPKVPESSPAKDASEIAKAHDQVLRNAEAMAAKIKELEEAQRKRDEQLAQFQALEERRRTEYGEANKAKLQEVLDINQLQYQEEFGEGSTLPEDYIASTTAAFMAPEASKVIEPILASARSWKKQRDARIAHEARLAEMEDKLNKMSEDQTLAMAHVNASRTRLDLATNAAAAAPATQIPVNASGDKKLNMANLFIPRQPSEQERTLMQMNYGRVPDVKVEASAAGAKELTLPPLPNQNLAKSVARSMRNDPGGRYLFHHVVANSQGFSRVHIPHQTERFVDPNK